jgi:hypothetical protein
VAAARRDRDAPTPADDGEALRRKVKHLTRLFCESTHPAWVVLPAAAQQDMDCVQCPQHLHTHATGRVLLASAAHHTQWTVHTDGSSALQVVASGGASASDAAASQRRPPQLTGATITGLPLWRVEWCVLPGMQVRVSACAQAHAAERSCQQQLRKLKHAGSLPVPHAP